MEYHFGKRVLKTETNKTGWKNIVLDSIQVSKPVVVCFGGNGVIDNKNANGLAKTAKSFLCFGLNKKDIPVYSIVYGNIKTTKTGEVGEITSSEVEEISKKLLLDRLTNCDGEKLDLLTAKKNVRNLNILTHCYGQIVVDAILSCSAKCMKSELGFSEQETKDILSGVLVVSYAPFFKSNGYGTRFELRTLADSKINNLENLSEDNLPFLGAGKLEKDKNVVTLLARSFIAENSKIDEHSIKTIRKEQGNINNNRTNAVSTIFSQVLSYGILNSLKNGQSDSYIKLLDADGIFSMTKPLLDSHNNSKREVEQKNWWNSKKEIEKMPTL